MAHYFFKASEITAITKAIHDAELNTSGEIRLHVEKHTHGDPSKRAVKLFQILGMHKTELRNGVLFYLATADHQFVILGDKGINEKVEDCFWNDVKDVVIAHFKKNEYQEGLSQGIRMAGEKLKAFFPFQDDDENELSNDISFGDQ